MTDNPRETRGQAIKRRRLAQGIDNWAQFARAVGVDRATVKRAESDEASENTYDKFETWLDRLEAGELTPAEQARTADVADLEEPEPEGGGLVTFNIAAIGVTVQGPVAHLGELEEAVAKLIRDARD